MIAIDTSALLAIALEEPAAGRCLDVLGREADIVISAGTVAEALIVAGGRNIVEQMSRLIDRMSPEIVPVTGAAAHRIAEAYRRWGKGRHPARLNFGDCFAYDVATQHSCPLLFVGDDFAKTDVQRAL